MSKTVFARRACVILLALGTSPALAATSFGVGYNDPAGIGSGYGSPVPFAKGEFFGGGSAGYNMVTSYAQTTMFDPVLTGTAGGSSQVSSELNLGQLGPFANKVTFQYALQVGGIDAGYGASAIQSSWLLGYTNGLGKFVGIGGIRSLSDSGVLMQEVLRYNGNDTTTRISKGFRGNFKFSLVIDPLVTPFTNIVALSSCSVTEGVNSGGYCAINFGFGIAPRATTASKMSAFAAGGDGFSTGGVPEPTSWAMLIAGFGVVGGAMRSRRGQPTAA